MSRTSQVKVEEKDKIEEEEKGQKPPERGQRTTERVVQPVLPNRQEPFKIIKIVFPRLHALLMYLLGNLGGRRQQSRQPPQFRSRTKITEVRRTDEGWTIIERIQ